MNAKRPDVRGPSHFGRRGDCQSDGCQQSYHPAQVSEPTSAVSAAAPVAEMDVGYFEFSVFDKGVKISRIENGRYRVGKSLAAGVSAEMPELGAITKGCRHQHGILAKCAAPSSRFGGYIGGIKLDSRLARAIGPVGRRGREVARRSRLFRSGCLRRYAKIRSYCRMISEGVDFEPSLRDPFLIVLSIGSAPVGGS